MMDFAIDLVTGDRIIANGGFVRVTGRRAVAQFIWARLNTYLGEWRLNPRYGLDIDLMMQKPTQKEVIDAELRALITGVPGVLAILEWSLEFSRQTRQMTLVAEVLVEGEEEPIVFTAEHGPLPLGLVGWRVLLGIG